MKLYHYSKVKFNELSTREYRGEGKGSNIKTDYDKVGALDYYNRSLYLFIERPPLDIITTLFYKPEGIYPRNTF